MFDLSNFTGSPALKARLEEKPLVLLVARNSSQGANARSYAAQELNKAAEGLLARTGLDVTGCIPDADTLRARIKSAPSQKTCTADGVIFTHKIVTIDDYLHAGVLIVLGTGTGRKTDELGAQPFVQYVLSQIALHKPALVFANRFDRFGRSTSAGVQLVEAAVAHKCFLGDAQDGIGSGDDDDVLVRFFKSYASDREAKGIPLKTRQSMKLRSGREMQDGKCPYSAQITPPPGLTRIRLKADSGAVGTPYLFLDSPQFYPSAEECSGGRPDVVVDGEPVDQVELVCWALENLGKEGKTKARVGQELARRGFSTDKYRAVHTTASSYPADAPKQRAYLPVRPIVENLEFYKTGVFHVHPGGDASNSFDVTGCFPPRGYWATPEDFARIEKYLEQVPKKRAAVRYGLVGVRANVGKTEAYLSANGQDDDLYKLRYSKEQGKRQIPHLPHKVLADIVVEGLMEAAKHVFIPVKPKDSPEVEAAALEVQQADAEAAKAARKAQSMQNQLLETDDDGVPILPQAVRKSLGEQLEPVLAAEEAARSKASLARRRLKALQAESEGSDGTPVNRLLLLVESLRDATRTEYNEEWKSILTFELCPMKSRKGGLRDNWVKITGVLRLSTDGEVFEVPLHGTYQPHHRTNPRARGEEVRDQLLAGVPYGDVEMGMKTELRRYVAAAFDVDPDYFALTTCPNGRIVRVAAHCTIHPTWSAKRVAAALGEPLALVKGVQERLGAGLKKKGWAAPRSPVISAFTRLAHEGNGVVSIGQLRQHVSDGPGAWHKLKSKPVGKAWTSSERGVYRLKPCPHCGHQERYANRLAGVVGWVCAACRKDDAGTVWDTDIDPWAY